MEVAFGCFSSRKNGNARYKVVHYALCRWQASLPGRAKVRALLLFAEPSCIGVGRTRVPVARRTQGRVACEDHEGHLVEREFAEMKARSQELSTS